MQNLMSLLLLHGDLQVAHTRGPTAGMVKLMKLRKLPAAAPRRAAVHCPSQLPLLAPPHFNHWSVPPGSPWCLATSLSPLSARRDLSRCGAPAEPRPDLPPAPIKRHRCATAFGWPAVALRAARTLLARCSAACAGCFALRAGCSRLSTNRASQSKTPQARRHAQVQGLLQCRPP